MWSTLRNVRTCFENWEVDLLDLGLPKNMMTELSAYKMKN